MKEAGTSKKGIEAREKNKENKQGEREKERQQDTTETTTATATGFQHTTLQERDVGWLPLPKKNVVERLESMPTFQCSRPCTCEPSDRRSPTEAPTPRKERRPWCSCIAVRSANTALHMRGEGRGEGEGEATAGAGV